jgi:hypothetical protein
MRHLQMVRGNVISMEKLRAAAGKHPPAREPDLAPAPPKLTDAEKHVAGISAAQMREVAEAVGPVPAWGTWLQRIIGRAMVSLAVLFRRRDK